MGRKILKKLTDNLGFKIMALVIAIVLWLVVYNTDDPKITKSFDATIVLENTDAITDANQYYTVLDGGTVTVSVTGKRSTLNDLSDSDFSAYADFTRMTVDSEGNGQIALEFSSGRYNSSLKFNGGTQYLHVKLEDAMSKQIKVEAATTGSVAEGYAIGNVSVSTPTVLTISGPASVVDTVARIEANINIDGITSTLTDYVTPTLYDSDGNEITDTSTLTFSSATVVVTVEVLNTKSVPIYLSTGGVPAEGLSVEGISSDITKVTVKGDASVLNVFSRIEVPAEAIDVTNATGTFITTVDITEYLPDGVSLVDSSQAIITVTVEMEEVISQVYTISTDNISIKGLADDYALTFDSPQAEVTVTGKSSLLESLTEAMLTGTIDVSSMGEGSHSAEVTFDLAGEDYQIDSLTLTFTIKKASSNGGNGSGNGNGNNNDSDTDDGNDNGGSTAE